MLFRKRVLKIVRHIPRGAVLTYKEVAERAGKTGAYRAVGNIVRGNYNTAIPCHRVIRSDGRIGGYNRGARKKVELLRREGYSCSI